MEMWNGPRGTRGIPQKVPEEAHRARRARRTRRARRARRARAGKIPPRGLGPPGVGLVELGEWVVQFQFQTQKARLKN